MKDPVEGGWSRGETFEEFLSRRGVSRREFLTFCGRMAACFAAAAALPGGSHALAEEMAQKLSGARRPSVIYLQLQECTGCLESLLRSGSSPIDRLVLEQVSLDYNELLMAPSGSAAEEVLREAAAKPHLLLVNGSVPLGYDGACCTIGGDSAANILRRAAQKADAIMAVGACAEYGCVQAASPNLTGAVGVSDVITDRPVVNISGCPPIAETITATLTYYLAYGHPPPLDGMGRPLFAYGQRIHDKCPRRASFDAGQFAERFDDENARRGHCLYRLGCKGPATFAPCATLEWNLGQSFPIKAGHPCLGCTERHFYDRMTPFYRRLPGFVVPGLGVEATANTIGAAAVVASVGGVMVHSAATVIAKKRAKKAQPETLPLAVLGDKEKPEEEGDKRA
ncbi:hydrogenase small subunit [Geomonas sp. Red69]|uniref:hydrogenase small subunit n=1 Tax=Geomonas diazotrophica TaxID=2843197 RepID=UPI001C113238|nr:hydrogenase small subunit [Geomonas diazotrophica]MBU5637656.1 hydrogenase small subunit [Geomonas diazotrophica]